MEWTFSLRGKATTFTTPDGVVAVRPTVRPRTAAERRRLSRAFGRPAREGEGGVPFDARATRRRFERAGWLFVAPSPAVARAAAAGRTVRGARAVRPVYLDPSGRLLVGTDRVVVQPPAGSRGRAALRRMEADGLRPVRPLPFAGNAYEARLPPGSPAAEAVRRLQAGGRYRVVEPQWLEAIGGRLRPTDPNYPDQWQHANIDSEAAWDLTRGRGPHRPVRVAVIDHGMQLNHPDLAAGVVGGGYFECDGVGDVLFRTFRSNALGFPNANHGTFCLGMAGARMDNCLGGCGSAPEADLLAVACCDDEIGTQATLARAVAYAADPACEGDESATGRPADVISCSLGGDGGTWLLTWVLDQAIRFATTAGRGGRGAPLFWAVSNDAVPLSGDQVCSHHRVIAVGKSDAADLASGSAYGPRLDFLAPGEAVFSTFWRGSYGQWTGTSFAAPLAAGVAALVLARHPRWAFSHVRRRLRQTCDKVGGVAYNARGHNDSYGHGRINAAHAAR